MKIYSLTCHCSRSEVHGFSPPTVNLQTCCTARQIRAGCKDVGCRFVLVETEAEFSDVDRLRLELVPGRPVLMTEGRPYCEVIA